MGIEIEGDLQFLSKYAKEFQIENERKLERFASDAVTGIDVRTRRGKNAQQRGLGTYRPSYQAYRKSVGRTGDTIELSLTGNMLRAMTYRVKRIGKRLTAEIFFNNTVTTSPKSRFGGGQRYTSIEAARATQNRFNWFGLDKGQRRKLTDIFRGNDGRRK